MKDAGYSKIMENLMSQKIFDNDLIAICKNKVRLRLKPAYAEMCIVDLSIALMYQFHYEYIKNKDGNKAGNMKHETKMFMKILAWIKKCLILVAIFLNQNFKYIKFYFKHTRYW